MGCERMAQRMHGGWFGDTGFLFRGVEHSLDTGFAVPPSGVDQVSVANLLHAQAGKPTFFTSKLAIPA